MLVKLSPEQVAESWQTLSPMIARALPPVTESHPRVMKKILERMLLGQIVGWLICDTVKNGEMKILGLGTTLISIDEGSTERNLLIYTLFAARPVSASVWRDGYDTLRRYANAEGCKNIIGYTSEPRVVDIIKALGGNANTTLIKMEV